MLKQTKRASSKLEKKRSLQESIQELDMQESLNGHNSIETIEATNSASPKVNNTFSQIISKKFKVRINYRERGILARYNPGGGGRCPKKALGMLSLGCALEGCIALKNRRSR